ncbi:MAG: helicase [Sinimarinibacterium flocculans]|uniref:helicase n=1 Tax=Sinimarinibacterium flocculans TaxID=985250 RepID=UPI003C3A200D
MNARELLDSRNLAKPSPIFDYAAFLDRKTQGGADAGFDPVFMPGFLFDFQGALVEWAVRKGRSALFADCGLGKSPMELVWAENIVRRTNGRVLLLTALAVSAQIIQEAEKFGIQARRSKDGTAYDGITVTNYERLHLFDPADFVGVVCDESSILKNFDSARKAEITIFMRKVPYRLLATATAAPNDYIELGTSSEALGYLGYMDMLNRFFKNDQGNSSTGRGFLGSANRWRFKGHAEQPFWRWVCSWARAVRRPSDLGFDDGSFRLPELREVEHLVEASTLADGMLFALPAAGLQEEREERRRTIRERCEKAASLVADTGKPAVAWCDLNDEGDLLTKMIPGAVQISGKDSDDAKEEKLLAFSAGEFRVLVTKQKIAGFGMNWQHCAHMTDFPSHSYEGYYQKVRRFLRFGQKHPVRVDMITTEGGRGALLNMQRKAAQADEMFSNLVSEMNRELALQRVNHFTQPEKVPAWL